MDYKFLIQLGIELIIFGGTAAGIYWKMHYRIKQVEKDNKSQDEKIVCLEKKVSNENKLIIKRLNRIEKILIRIDERMGTKATTELISDDDEA